MKTLHVKIPCALMWMEWGWDVCDNCGTKWKRTTFPMYVLMKNVWLSWKDLLMVRTKTKNQIKVKLSLETMCSSMGLYLLYRTSLILWIEIALVIKSKCGN